MSALPASRELVAGIVWALLAGACWGVSFIAGLMLPDFTAGEISAGRYIAYGLFSLAALLIAVLRSGAGRLREPKLWAIALAMSLLGNVVYFTAITAAVRLANAPIGSLIIGLLPIAMPVAANLIETTFPWRKLAVPSALMLAGLTLVHLGEAGPNANPISGSGADYWLGIALYVAALLAWTSYGIANARFLARRTDLDAGVWASLQGAVLLPLAIPFLASVAGGEPANVAARSWQAFAAVSILLGVVASWTALVCWNRVTQLLPAAVAGQLLVFETIAGLCYAYAWKASFPPALVVAGAISLIAGVVIGVRAIAARQSAPGTEKGPASPPGPSHT